MLRKIHIVLFPVDSCVFVYILYLCVCVCGLQKNVLQDDQRDHVWNLEGFYALALFFTIFIIITTCLMVICDSKRTETGTTVTSYTRVWSVAGCCSLAIVPHEGAVCLVLSSNFIDPVSC